MNFTTLCFLLMEVLPKVRPSDRRGVTFRLINTLDLLEISKISQEHKKLLLDACVLENVEESMVDLMSNT